MKHSTITLIFGLLISCSVNWAQSVNILQEFKEMHHHYDQMKAFGLDFEIVYFDINGNRVMETSGSVVHSEKVNYTRIGERTSLITGTEYISVNSDNKFIVYNKFEKNKREKHQNQENTDISSILDSLWSSQKDLVFKQIQSKEGTLRVYIEDSKSEYFDSYEIMVNTIQNELISFTYYFKIRADEEPLSKVRITYSNETGNPNLKAKKLRVSYYVKKAKNHLIVTDRYKNFQIVDQTKTTENYD